MDEKKANEHDDATVLITDTKKDPASLTREAPTEAALVLITGKLHSTVFDLVEEETSVGRTFDNTIVLDFGGISRHHFKVVMNQEEFTVSDAGSKNGTFVNGNKIDSAVPLKKGDIIQVGDVAFKYIPRNDPERLSYDKLQWEACRDLHTSCYNKSYFNNALNLEFQRAKKSGNPLALIFFDLDHFKALNDNHGHDAGDSILKELADIVHKEGPSGKSIFARYGGEEFAILLPDTNLKEACKIAEHLRAMIEKHPFTYEDNNVTVTASFGVAEHTEQMATAKDFFKKADSATYKAKANGRNNVQYVTN